MYPSAFTSLIIHPDLHCLFVFLSVCNGLPVDAFCTSMASTSKPFLGASAQVLPSNLEIRSLPRRLAEVRAHIWIYTYTYILV